MQEMADHISLLLEMAREKLKSAEILVEAGQWRDAASRAYYCAFHAASAVLLTRDLCFSSHAQTIEAFNREFVKTGIFPRDFGRRLAKMQRDREAGDYRATAPFGEAVAREDVAIAGDFLASCQSYLEDCLAEE